MVGVVLTVALAALLATGASGGAAGGAAGGAVGPDSAAATAPAITLTTVNWGHPVSLTDAAHPGWGHLAPQAGPTEVTASIQLNGLLVHNWVAQLFSDAAYGGKQPDDCRGSEEATPTELSCVFQVPVSLGVNGLTVSFSADGSSIGDAHGVIRGGALEWDARFEVLDATGAWVAIARDHAVALSATASTAIREVVTNTGTIPMRLERPPAPAVESASCAGRILDPHERLVCTVRGVRPAQSLSGDLRRELRVVDAVGGIAEYEVRGGLTTFAGTFSLSRTSATVGQVVIVHARGLPRDQAFAVQYRLDDQSVLVGMSITRSGSLDYGVVVPATSPGTVHLNIEHDGVAIASLPFDVTLVPRKPDAAPPGWPWLLVLLGALVGLLVAWRVVRARRRAAAAAAAAAAATESPEPPPTDPYPAATPATPEPAAARPT